MSTPQNKRKQAQRSRFVTIFTGIAIFYTFLHIPKAWDGSAESIEAVVTHMFTRPFDIFPMEGDFLVTGFILSVCVMLLMYQHFLDRRNLRPNEESGSAKWNEDMPKFYLQYADGKLKYTLPKLKGKGTFSKIVNKFLADLDKLFFGWSYTLNQDTGGDKTWTYVDDDNGNRLYKHHGTKNMILSQDVVLSMNTRQTLRNNNILVIGGSGTGKSRFMIKPNMLQANCSFVITDPSGELLESMGSFLKEKGYDIRVFNLVQMDHSHCYNPFHYIRNQEGVLTMINALIKNTTPKGSSTNDPFWEKAETALLQAICFYLIAECNPDDQNFNSVMKLLRCVDAGEGSEEQDSVLDVLMNDLREKDPEHIALQSYAVFKSAGGGKTAQSILISCQTRLQVFNLSVIKDLTNTDNIDLKTVGDRPTALFCITPVVDTTFNFLVALLYTQLFETLYFHAETECNEIYHQGLRLPVHVRFLLDEFANIGTIPEFSQKLATMRKYEISCTIVIQALSQLKAMYKDDWEVLVGNCDTQVFLGGTDKTTLEYISQKLGKETIRAENSSRNFGRQGSSSVSFNKTGRELLQMDEIARMDNINSIVFIRGVLPFFTKKYDYPKHPNYHMTGDADGKLGFDVKRTVNTAAPQATSVEISQAKRREIKEYAEKTDDSVANAMYEYREHVRDRERETLRRNRAVRSQEATIKKEMDADVGSVKEAVEKNQMSISAEQLENHISSRYQVDDMYKSSDGEFEVSGEYGSSMEDEPFSLNTDEKIDEQIKTQEEVHELQEEVGVPEETFSDEQYLSEMTEDSSVEESFDFSTDDEMNPEDENVGNTEEDIFAGMEFDEGLHEGFDEEFDSDSFLPEFGENERESHIEMDEEVVSEEDVLFEWRKETTPILETVIVRVDGEDAILYKVASESISLKEELLGRKCLYIDAFGEVTEDILSEEDISCDDTEDSLSINGVVFSFTKDLVFWDVPFTKGVYVFADNYNVIKIM